MTVLLLCKAWIKRLNLIGWELSVQWIIEEKCRFRIQIHKVNKNHAEHVLISKHGQNNEVVLNMKNQGWKKISDYNLLRDTNSNTFFDIQDSQSVSQPISKETNDKGRFRDNCPLDKDELGRSTWNLLHTMAATYPDNPSDEQKQNVNSFFNILSKTYPCDVCAKDLVTEYVTLNHYYAIWDNFILFSSRY